MAERIDIYNANLEHMGVMDRAKAHVEGQWHRTFHCWVVRAHQGGQVLFQQRSQHMKNFPGMLDVSAAGHLEAGETVLDGIREMREELGIDVTEKNLVDLGQRVEVADQTNGQKNREYQSVFIYEIDFDLPKFDPNSHEVTALLWLPIESGMNLFTGKIDSVIAEGYSFEAEPQGVWTHFSRSLSAEDFLPRIQRYYLTILIMSERVINRSGPVSIS